MTHDEYEALVRSMVQELTTNAQALGSCVVNGGAQNRITGASGFAHQVDVTTSNPTDMLLIECKYWTQRVDAEPVLVLAARIADISAAVSTTRVHGSIVSTKEPTAGARVLAAHFRINIDTVLNPREYALRVFNHVFAGIHEGGHLTDTAEGEVIRGSGG
jgi:hypothetical protein